MQSTYDSYDSANQGGNYDNVEVRFAPYTTIEAEIERVFGSDSQYGQSLGVVFDNAELVDGVFYYYPEKERYKIVSWKDVAGVNPSEAYDRGMDLTAEDADEIYTENYGSSTQTYELAAARTSVLEDENGDVVAEATSRRRDVTDNGGDLEFGDFEDLEGATIALPRIISWFDGSDEYGPSASAKSLLEKASEFGDGAVVDEDDIYNWLPDTSGENIVRSDIVDRRVRFFVVTRESSETGYTYNVPVLEDAKTGEEIVPSNSAPDGGSGNENSGTSDDSESDAVSEARSADERDYPEPIADFIQSGKRLNMNDQRANNLLDELVSDSSNALTEQMLADNGGRDAIVNEVVIE